MLFSRVQPEQVEACIGVVNTRYAGNVIAEWCCWNQGQVSRISANRWRGRIIVLDSRGLGARRSASGRRGRWACWHVFRDVFAEVFRVYPEAKIATGMATYTADTWHDRYPATGRVNVGTLMQFVTMPELCDCAEET